MFTGRKPVYKDKDGRYFIEADPASFKAILHFLIYDELPFQDPGNSGSRGFGHFGRGQGLFGSFASFTARDIELLYKDSLNLGLKTLSEALFLFEPNFVNSKMDDYRQTIRGYDKTIAAILDIVPAETLFHKTEFTIRIRQDLQTIDDEKCCEHDCKTSLPTNFSFSGQQYSRNVNAIVKVSFEVNSTVLSAFVIDFQKRGYIVQGELAECGFECKKDEVKQSKYVVFGSKRRYCCTEELFLLHFKWEVDTHFTFGAKNAIFGQAPENKGFSFGAPEQKQNSNVGLFGGFGASQQQNFGSGFGSGQTAATFGSPQQQLPSTDSFNFGGGQGKGFWSNTQQSGFGFIGQGHSVDKGTGQQQNQQQQQQSLFSKAPNPQGPSLFGSSAFNNQESATAAAKNAFGGNQQSLFGQAQNVQQKGSSGPFSFGSPKSSSGQPIFGKSPNTDQPLFGGKPVFRSNFASVNPQQIRVTVSPDDVNALKASADNKTEVTSGKPAFNFNSSNQ